MHGNFFLSFQEVSLRMCNRTKGSGCAGAGIPVRVQTCSLFIGRVGRGMAGDDAMGRSWRMSSRYMIKNLIQNKPTRRDCRAAPHRNYLQTSPSSVLSSCRVRGRSLARSARSRRKSPEFGYKRGSREVQRPSGACDLPHRRFFSGCFSLAVDIDYSSTCRKVCPCATYV